MAHDVGPRSLLRGLVVIALLWWAWCSYAWLGNQARADEGIVRLGMLVAMAALFLVALCIRRRGPTGPGATAHRSCSRCASG
jgi:low temperature requirement protein LtrA